jgi:serine protease AprX
MLRRYALLSILALFAVSATAGHKIAKDLENLDPDSNVDVIIQYKETPGAAHHLKMRARGGRHNGDLALIQASHYTVQAKTLAEIENDPNVVAVSPDRELRPMLDLSAVAVGATIAQANGYTGAGIGVAVLDSGIYSSYLGSALVYSKNFTDSTSTGDWYGHGSHVAGILASSNASYKGLAPGVKIVNLKVLNDSGVGRDSWIIAAIDEAIRLKATYNIRVMNLSLGRPVTESYTTDPLCQAVERAWQAGIVVVVAAGNEGRNNSQQTNGYGTITVPGNDPYVITVGAMKTNGTATRADDTIASYSSKGPTLLDHIVKPDLVAPGNKVVSTLYYNCGLVSQYPANKISNDFFRLSGTSMAAPAVSAASALLLQKYPSLTPDQVKARLMKTASKAFPSSSTVTDPATGITYTSQYDVFTVGAGYLDVWAALNDGNAVTGTAVSPSVSLNAATKTVSMVFANGVVWGSGIVWGTGIVWGNGVVGGTGIVWGNGVVWGSSGPPSATGVIWGTGVVWGCGTPAAEAVAIAISGEN